MSSKRRKRYVKRCMSEGVSRNTADAYALEIMKKDGDWKKIVQLMEKAMHESQKWQSKQAAKGLAAGLREVEEERS